MTRPRTILSLVFVALLSASWASAAEHELRHRSDAKVEKKATVKKAGTSRHGGTTSHTTTASHGARTAEHAAAPATHGARTAEHAAAPATHGARTAEHAAAPATHGAGTAEHARATTHGAPAATRAAGNAAHAPAASHAPAAAHATPAAAHGAPAAGAPEAVWADLLAGNARFIVGKSNTRALVSQRLALVAGQHPRTIVLTCSDSRVPPELVFDQSLGDLFVVRTAGEVVDAVATGSIEYAVEHLGANLIVVLGHEKCGAVAAALSDGAMPTPSLTALVGHIRPGIEKPSHAFQGDERLRYSIEANVEHSAEELVARSPVLRERIEHGDLLVVKAVYALGGGAVRELGRGVDLEAAAAMASVPMAEHEETPAGAPAAHAPVAAHAPAAAHATAAAAHGAPAAGAPEAVWADLLAGNGRFVVGKPNTRALVSQRLALVAGQHPRTIVLTCSDSRVPPELVFDQSLGDLFVVRTAGEVVDAVATGSIEYAVEHLGANLIVVLGHEKCGAVAAALSDGAMPTPSLTALVGHIRPGIEKPSHAFQGDERLRYSIEANVEHSAEELVARSPVLRERIEHGDLLVVKAVYALGGGAVRELGRGVDLETAAAKSTPATMRDAMLTQLQSAPPAVPAGPPLAGVDASAPPKVAPSVAATVPGAPAAAAPITWEGQLRYRYEARSVLDYRLPGTFKRPAAQALGDAGDVSIMRTRVGATLRLAPGVRGYFNLQDARVMGAEGSPGGTLANVDLHQAYVDLDSLGGQPLALRAGRQPLIYGDGRIVGPAEWGNAGRAFDGARLRFAPKHWQMDGFVTWINEGRLTGQDRLFAGVDATWRGLKGLEFEGYHFARSFGDTAYVAENGRKGGLYDGTSGGRLRAAHGRFEVKAEGAIQQGRRAGDKVRGWFGTGRLAVDMPGAWKPRVMAEHVIASGDQDPADGLGQRFDPVYWSGHGYQGALDIVGAANLKDWCGGLTLQPGRAWTVQSEFHAFALLRARDAWVDDAGTTLRGDATGAAGTDLGREMDLTVKWDTRPRVSLLGGWSRFWPGTFVTRTGGGNALDWGFLQMAVGF